MKRQTGTLPSKDDVEINHVATFGVVAPRIARYKTGRKDLRLSSGAAASENTVSWRLVHDVVFVQNSAERPCPCGGLCYSVLRAAEVAARVG